MRTLKLPWKRRGTWWVLWAIWAVSLIVSLTLWTTDANPAPTPDPAPKAMQWYWDDIRAELKAEARPAIIHADCTGRGEWIPLEGKRLYREFRCRLEYTSGTRPAKLFVTGRFKYQLVFLGPIG